MLLKGWRVECKCAECERVYKMRLYMISELRILEINYDCVFLSLLVRMKINF